MKPTTLCGEFHKSKKKWVPASVCRCRCQHVIVSHSLSKDRAKLQITFDYRIYIIFFLVFAQKSILEFSQHSVCYFPPQFCRLCPRFYAIKR